MQGRVTQEEGEAGKVDLRNFSSPPRERKKVRPAETKGNISVVGEENTRKLRKRRRGPCSAAAIGAGAGRQDNEAEKRYILIPPPPSGMEDVGTHKTNDSRQ